MDPRLIAPVMLGALVLWAVYRRVRRNFGRQAVNTTRLYFRIALLAVVGALVAMASARDMGLVGALAGGLAGGAALGVLGLRHTAFETTPEGRFYTPHTYIGLVVTAAFLGRLIYRLTDAFLAAHDTVRPDQDPLGAYQKSPLTLAVFGLLIGYYLIFNLGILRHSRNPAAPSPGSPGP